MKTPMRIDAEKAEWLQRYYTQRAGVLLIWTVTTGTRDFGPRYVARPHKATRDPGVLPFYLIADRLDALRRMLPPGLMRMPRDPDDKAIIVEVWL